VALRDDGSVESTTPTVTEWFGDLEDETLQTTIVLHQVARRARALATGGRVAEPVGSAVTDLAPARVGAHRPRGVAGSRR